MIFHDYVDADQARFARPVRGLAIYLVGVVVLSAPLEAGHHPRRAPSTTPLRSVLWVSALMLVPTMASVVARLIGREGFADLGFRRGHDVGRHLVFALLFPFVIAAVAYGAAWATGLVGLRMLPLGMWTVLFLAMLALNVVVSTGEELAWRGYMLALMRRATGSRRRAHCNTVRLTREMRSRAAPTMS